MESELFGYEKGAFTGAVGAKPGRFELAARRHAVPRRDRRDPGRDAGQAAARRCRRREFERVGGIKTIKVDVRLVAATNRDLQQEIAAGDVPRGPLLPAERRPDPHPAAARAARGHPAARRALPREVQRAPEEADRRGIAAEALDALMALRLAGQHPRARERDRADDAVLRGRPRSERRRPAARDRRPRLRRRRAGRRPTPTSRTRRSPAGRSRRPCAPRPSASSAS